uniref:Uncharacterized protein n=1 Tax=Avena sativa TaxID=4498 RepID=A0ACD5VVS9_AVESA
MREPKSSVLRWSPPPAGMVLVNVDAAIFSATRRMGVGVVIQDHNGLSVVNRVIAVELDRSLCGPVIQDIRCLMASFEACSVRHVPWGLNVAAHIVAKKSESLGCVVWRGVSPDCIREISFVMTL